MRTTVDSLASLEEITGLNAVQPNTCWLDGSSCPYGEPYGRFNDRPRKNCHIDEGGCGKLRASVGIQILASPIVDKELDRFEKATKKEIDEQREPLHELLEYKANSLAEKGRINNLEKVILLCASKVLKDQFPQIEVMEITE